MAIDLEREDVFPIAQARDCFPGRPNLSTIYRWMLRGVRGVKLETILVGGRRFVSREALQRFADAATAAQSGEPMPVRTSSARRRAIERAERELNAAGI